MEVFALQRSLIWLVKLHVAAPRERPSEQGGVASVWQVCGKLPNLTGPIILIVGSSFIDLPAKRLIIICYIVPFRDAGHLSRTEGYFIMEEILK